MRSLFKFFLAGAVLPLMSGCCDEPLCIPFPKPDCVCTLEYNPVCGCDGRTYGNPCNAHCNNIYVFTPGECP